MQKSNNLDSATQTILSDEFLEFLFKLICKDLELLAEFVARIPDCFIWLDSAICMDLDFNFFFERMRFLVASKSDPWILKELMPDNITKRVIMILHMNSWGILLFGVINAANKISWNLDRGSISSGRWPTRFSSNTLKAYTTCKTSVNWHRALAEHSS